MSLTSPSSRAHRKKLAVQAAYVERNREEIYAQNEQYRQENKAKFAAYYREYRRRKSGKVLKPTTGV